MIMSCVACGVVKKATPFKPTSNASEQLDPLRQSIRATKALIEQLKNKR
jgi:hypothetical protein